MFRAGVGRIMAHILLTGAGFSRNWGGWLANEVFESLIGEVDEHLRHLLWQSKRRAGGFEDTLAELEHQVRLSGNERVKKQLVDLQTAIVGVFNAMNEALKRTQFERHPGSDIAYLVRTFLARFDAIFTLNQDVLLEHHYLDDNISLAHSRKWSGWQLPGTKPFGPPPLVHDPVMVRTAMRMPDEGNFREEPRLQPYYKLHGSTNWTGGGSAGGRLLIMGGNKAVEIGQYPLLNWYHRQFQEHLLGASRLMIIGYSFSDAHINRVIIEAAKERNIGVFIVDPAGVDVLNKQDPRHLQAASELMAAVEPQIIGASRRNFLSTFSDDSVEFDKLSRFFLD
jgi:hypothetical protein